MKLKTLVIGGSGLFLMVFSLLLFVAILFSDEQDSGISNIHYGGVNVSAEVLAHKPMVEKYAKEYGVEEYVNILLAIIPVSYTHLERAYYAVRDLLVYDNPEHTAFKIINRYIRFVDKDDSKPRSDWKLNEEWAWFIGNNRERLKLTTKPEPYSFQRTLNWLSHQVAPTLKVAIKLDEINQTQVVKDILDHAKLTDRHKQILKQQSAKEQDVDVYKRQAFNLVKLYF